MSQAVRKSGAGMRRIVDGRQMVARGKASAKADDESREGTRGSRHDDDHQISFTAS